MSSAALGSHPHVLARADVSPVIEPNRAEGSLHEP